MSGSRDAWEAAQDLEAQWMLETGGAIPPREWLDKKKKAKDNED
jgi:hypothetical protein